MRTTTFRISTAALAITLAAGCEGLTSDPQPLVSVLKQTDEGCFALMTPDTPISPTLDVSGTCSYGTEPRLMAADDLVEVVVDYGPDVDFAGTTHAPPPVLTLAIDGVLSDEPIQVSQEQRVGGRAYFVATFRAPATLSTDVRLTAGVNPGFQTAVPVVFAIVSPPVSLQVTDCPPGIACQLAGAVGSAHLKVDVPGQIPQLISIHTTLDGVAQPDPIPPFMTAPAGTYTEHLTAIPVPAAHDGAVWAVSAQLGSAPPSSVTVSIQAPTITTALSCGTCPVSAGQSVGLEVIAPAQIHPLQALVDTHIDGVPQLVSAPVTLVPHADGTASGTLALQAPAAGTWQIDASVAGYSAPAIVKAVQ